MDQMITNYDKAPERWLTELQGWVEGGLVPDCTFLKAILLGDLYVWVAEMSYDAEKKHPTSAVTFLATEVSDTLEVLTWLADQAPSAAWGSSKRVSAWRELHRQRRESMQ